MSLRSRVSNLLTRPASEWQVIAAESSDVPRLYRDYILLLAAIPPICLFIGIAAATSPLIGHPVLAVSLAGATVSYVSALVGVLLAAVIIQMLAPIFGSHGDTAQALKLVAYSYTPVWLAGVAYLVAGVLTLSVLLAPVAIVAAIYAIYLFYLGLPPVMKAPADKVVPYMLVAALVIVVINIVLRLIVGATWVMPVGYGRMF